MHKLATKPMHRKETKHQYRQEVYRLEFEAPSQKKKKLKTKSLLNRQSFV